MTSKQMGEPNGGLPTAHLARLPSVRSRQTGSFESERGRGARQVRVRLTVFDVPEISISTSRFTCNFFLEASWLDPTLQDGDSMWLEDWDQQFPFVGRHGPRRWTPRLHFQNVLELKDKEEWFHLYTKSRDELQPLETPVVCYRLRACGVFRERFELGNFPFDAQDLQIQIVSMHHKRNDALSGAASPLGHSQAYAQVELVKNETEEYVCVTPGDDHDRFTLYDEYIMSTEIRQIRKDTLARHSTTGKVYPLLILSMKVTRRPGFYIWQVYLPMFMLVILSFPVLLLPVSDLSGRLGCFFTLILAAVAYKNWIGDNLPRCSYLTQLDIYVLGSISIMFFVTLESACVFWVQKYLLDDGGFLSWMLDAGEDFIGILSMVIWIWVHVWIYRRNRASNPEAVTSALEHGASTEAPRTPPRIMHLGSWHTPVQSPQSDESILRRRAG
eukprot:TRINITY_DN60367_c0_g1_i1.p1 TRINITY_DN60367_c0_g1~~TRINITY_DN60367_c0_g1_i1.p1  ORF type:complete len:443 (-),score=24.30 TRINITY_DN60367_c0_g1_i1:102-1430(-)